MKKDNPKTFPVLILLIALPFAFSIGGIWIGLITLVGGVVALGWSKRHEGPFEIKNETVTIPTERLGTDRRKELIAIAMYENSFKHLQQLIIDSDKCYNDHGKKIILDKDKFDPSYDEFKKTIAKCIRGLIDDGYITLPQDDEISCIKSLNKAMRQLEEVYGNSNYGFLFWNGYYEEYIRNGSSTIIEKIEDNDKTESAEENSAVQENGIVALFIEKVANNKNESHAYNFLLKSMIDKEMAILKNLNLLEFSPNKKSVATDVLGELLNFKKENMGFDKFDNLMLDEKFKKLTKITSKYNIKTGNNKIPNFSVEHNNQVSNIVSLFFHAHMIANRDIGNSAKDAVIYFVNSTHNHNLTYDIFR
jgi:hypothetical protein